ncbi:hypothetical protein ACFX12_010000 [Malus domestica]
MENTDQPFNETRSVKTRTIISPSNPHSVAIQSIPSIQSPSFPKFSNPHPTPSISRYPDSIRAPFFMMVKNNPNPNPNPNPKVPVPDQNEEIDWEMRPGGMLVQRREDEDAAAVANGVGASASSRGPMIKIDVVLGPGNGPRYELFLPAHSTFGDMKKHVSQKANLEPEVQRLFFRGMEKADEEHLDIAGVKNNSKVLLLEARKESKVEEVNQSNEMRVGAGEVRVNSKEVPTGGGDVGGKSNVMSKASQAIAEVRAEVDKLAERVAALEVAVAGRNEVSDKEFVVPTELLTRQLLKLDGIQAEGEEKMQRKAEVRRVQNFVDALDALKTRNSNPVNNSSNAVTVTTEWETFDSGVGSLNPPTSTPEPSSTEPNQEWEHFD